MSGSIGVQGHYANGLAALFIACGQDAACVAEAAVGVTRFELREDGGLYAAVTLPNMIVGTVGGGTGLPSQRACLEILGLAGPGHARALCRGRGGACAGGRAVDHRRAGRRPFHARAPAAWPAAPPLPPQPDEPLGRLPARALSARRRTGRWSPRSAPRRSASRRSSAGRSRRRRRRPWSSPSSPRCCSSCSCASPTSSRTTRRTRAIGRTGRCRAAWSRCASCAWVGVGARGGAARAGARGSSRRSCWLLLVAWVYLALMTREFFVARWLKRAAGRLHDVAHGDPAAGRLYATACDWWVAGLRRPPAGLFWFLVVSYLNGIVDRDRAQDARARRRRARRRDLQRALGRAAPCARGWSPWR